MTKRRGVCPTLRRLPGHNQAGRQERAKRPAAPDHQPRGYLDQWLHEAYRPPWRSSSALRPALPPASLSSIKPAVIASSAIKTPVDASAACKRKSTTSMRSSPRRSPQVCCWAWVRWWPVRLPDTRPASRPMSSVAGGGAGDDNHDHHRCDGLIWLSGRPISRLGHDAHATARRVNHCGSALVAGPHAGSAKEGR